MQTTAIVVGAGVAGLQTARALLKHGFSVTVLEQSGEVGGVWSANYAGFGLQVPFTCYEFPEFPWPDELIDNEFPSGAAVQRYVNAYAEYFGLMPHIRLHCQLKKVAPCATGGWTVTYHNQESRNPELLVADTIVICTGLLSTPRVPAIKGQELFRGVQMHAKEMTDVSLADRKRVVVIGAGKTALDCAAEVAVSGRAAGITWLFRQPHWPIPRQLFGNTPMEKILFSMLPTALIQPYYTATKSRGLLRRLLRPAQAFAWRSLERSIIKEFNLVGALVPEQPLETDLLFSGQVVEPTWHELVEHSMTVSSSKNAAAAKRRSRLLGGWWGRKSSPTPVRGSAAAGERGSAAASHPGAAYSSSQAEQSDAGAFASGEGGSSFKTGRGSMLAAAQQGPQTAGSQLGCESPRGSPCLLHGGVGVMGDTPASPRGSGAAAAGVPTTPRSPRPGAGAEDTLEDGPFAQAGDGSGQYGATWAQRKQYALQQQRARRAKRSNFSLEGNACVSIRPVRGEVVQFTQQAVLLADGQHLPADLVLYCTGYTKNYDYLDGGVKARLGLQKDGLYLYRSILPPQVPRIAFVGSEVSTFNNILTSGLQAEWLAEHWTGGAQLPTPEEMAEDVRQQIEWRRKLVPLQRARATVYQLFQQQYHKQLVKDMGLTAPRLRLRSLLTPVTAADYQHVFERPITVLTPLPVEWSNPSARAQGLGQQLTAHSERAWSGELGQKAISRVPSEQHHVMTSVLSSTSSVANKHAPGPSQQHNADIGRSSWVQIEETDKEQDEASFYQQSSEGDSSRENLSAMAAAAEAPRGTTSKAGARRHSTCCVVPASDADGMWRAASANDMSVAPSGPSRSRLNPKGSLAGDLHVTWGVKRAAAAAAALGNGTSGGQAAAAGGAGGGSPVPTAAAAAAAAAAGSGMPGSTSGRSLQGLLSLGESGASPGSTSLNSNRGNFLQKLSKIRVPGDESDTEAVTSVSTTAGGPSRVESKASLAMPSRVPSESTLLKSGTWIQSGGPAAAAAGALITAAGAGSAAAAATAAAAAASVGYCCSGSSFVSGNARALMARLSNTAGSDWVVGSPAPIHASAPAAPVAVAAAAAGAGAGALATGGLDGAPAGWAGPQVAPGGGVAHQRFRGGPTAGPMSPRVRTSSTIGSAAREGVWHGSETSGLLSSPRGQNTRSSIGSLPYCNSSAAHWAVLAEASTSAAYSSRPRTTSTIGAPGVGHSMAGAVMYGSPPASLSSAMAGAPPAWYGPSPELLNPAAIQHTASQGGGASQEPGEEMEGSCLEEEYDPIGPIKALVRQLQEQAAQDSEQGARSPRGFPPGAHTFSAYKVANLLRSGSPALATPVSASSVSSANSAGGPTPGQLRLQQEAAQQEHRERLEQEKSGKKGGTGSKAQPFDRQQQQMPRTPVAQQQLPPGSPRSPIGVPPHIVQYMGSQPGSPGARLMALPSPLSPVQQQLQPQVKQPLTSSALNSPGAHSASLPRQLQQHVLSPCAPTTAAAATQGNVPVQEASVDYGANSSRAAGPITDNATAAGPATAAAPSRPAVAAAAGAAAAAAATAAGIQGTAAALHASSRGPPRQDTLGAFTQQQGRAAEMPHMRLINTSRSSSGSGAGGNARPEAGANTASRTRRKSTLSQKAKQQQRQQKQQQQQPESEDEQSDPSVDYQEMQRSRQLVQLWLEQKHEDADPDLMQELESGDPTSDESLVQPFSGSSIISVLTGVPSRQHSRARSSILHGSSSCHSRDFPTVSPQQGTQAAAAAGHGMTLRLQRSVEHPFEGNNSPMAVAHVALQPWSGYNAAAAADKVGSLALQRGGGQRQSMVSGSEGALSNITDLRLQQ